MSAAHTPGSQCVECEGFCLQQRAETATVTTKASDLLAFELTGYRPEQLTAREAEIIRGRAQVRWDQLIAIASTSRAPA